MTIAAAPRAGAVVAALRGAVVHRGQFTLGPVDLQIDWADRVAITGANAVERFFHDAGPAAVQADHLEHGAMNFDNARGGIAGALMQPVDILRNECMQLAPAFQVCQRGVARIRCCAPCRMGQPRLPCGLTHIAVVNVIVDVR